MISLTTYPSSTPSGADRDLRATFLGRAESFLQPVRISCRSNFTGTTEIAATRTVTAAGSAPRQRPQAKHEPQQQVAAQHGLPSRHDLFHHVALHIGQPQVAAAVAVGQLLVIEAEQVQDGRVQVVDVDPALDALAAVVVGGAVAKPRLHAAAGQPDREAAVVVVAAVAPSANGRAAELAGPDDQRVLQQAALLQVREQRGDRLVHAAAHAAGSSLRSLWWSQPPRADLDEAHARLGELAAPTGTAGQSCPWRLRPMP